MIKYIDRTWYVGPLPLYAEMCLIKHISLLESLVFFLFGHIYSCRYCMKPQGTLSHTRVTAQDLLVFAVSPVLLVSEW